MASLTQEADTQVLRWSGRRWRTVVVSCLAVALVIAAMAALYTALPALATDTGATQVQATWIVDGYTLALACLVLPAGSISDRYGRRRVLIAGLGVFAIASAVPLFISALAGLIAARVVAGAGAAMVMPSTLSLITAGFPERSAPRAIGMWAGFAGVGGMLGLVGSGLLLQHWSWQSIFGGLAVAAVILLAAAFSLQESRAATTIRLDPLGAITSIAAIGMLVWALIAAGDRGWGDRWILTAMAGATVATVAFVVTELWVRSPLLQLRLLARRGFSAGAVSITIQFLVTFGLFLINVQYLQLMLGYSPLGSALAVLPMGAGVVALSIFSPRLAARYGLRLPTTAGFIALTAGLLLMSRQTPASGYPGVLVPLLVISFGLGLAAAPATAAIITETDADHHGVAAAVNDAAREIGAALGIAIAGTVLAAGYRSTVTPALEHIPEPARTPLAHSLAATTQLADRVGPRAQPLLEVSRTAFLHGLHLTALTLAALTLITAIALTIWAPGRHHRTATNHDNA